MQKYTVNHTYFQCIDSEEKAYWLGFIAADGCIVCKPDGRLYTTVKLSLTDEGHLRKLASSLEFDGPFYYQKNDHPSVRLSSYSQELASNLVALGVTQRKTGNLGVWDGPPELLRHYWRGLFDGNGSLSVPNSKYLEWHASYCGSELSVKGFWDFMKGNQVPGGTMRKDSVARNHWYAFFGGRRGPWTLVNILYGGATLYLDRKYNIAQEWLLHDPLDFMTELSVGKDLANVIDLLKTCRTIKQVAEAKRVHPSTIRRFIKNNTNTTAIKILKGEVAA
jgi:hypothetical protein